MGESRVIKDNYIFGLSEKKDSFNIKVSDEDTIRNRDAKDKANKNCDFWLVFDNGVRLMVEMQDH